MYFLKVFKFHPSFKILPISSKVPDINTFFKPITQIPQFFKNLVLLFFFTFFKIDLDFLRNICIVKK